MNKKEILYKRIQEHGKNLNAIFLTKYSNIGLCKKLLRIEHKAHKLATDWCNGDITTAKFDLESFRILKKVREILSIKEKNKFDVFVNGDARGYALKLKSEFVKNKSIHRDLGGFGIIAPDFREFN